MKAKVEIMNKENKSSKHNFVIIGLLSKNQDIPSNVLKNIKKGGKVSLAFIVAKGSPHNLFLKSKLVC